MGGVMRRARLTPSGFADDSCFAVALLPIEVRRLRAASSCAPAFEADPASWAAFHTPLSTFESRACRRGRV